MRSPVAFGRFRRRAVLLFVLGLLLPSSALRNGIYIPPRLNPLAPLELDHSPGPFTRMKLHRLSQEPSQCLALLATSSFEFEPLPDRVTGPDCGFNHAIRLTRTGVAISPAVSLSCRTAISLALWERHVLQTAALEHFGVPVAQVEHFGTYACRNVYGRTAGRRSQHATADAIDIAGFILTDGRRIRIINDWEEDDGTATVESAFLRDLHRGACRFFDAVLGPDYNEAHRDHFHFDRGGFRACR